MRISMRGDYGVRAIVDLAMHYGEGPIQSAEIARRQNIPEPYLDQLLTVLRKGGVIRSMRGPQGGHTLLSHPSTLHLGTVLRILEGSLAPLSCLEDTESCAMVESCASREVWQRVQEATDSILDAVSIEDLAKRQASYDSRMMYHI